MLLPISILPGKNRRQKSLLHAALELIQTNVLICRKKSDRLDIENWITVCGRALGSSSWVGLRKSGRAPSSSILSTANVFGRRLGACRVASGRRTALMHFGFFWCCFTFALRLILLCSLLFWTFMISLHRSHETTFASFRVMESDWVISSWRYFSFFECKCTFFRVGW